MAQRQLAWRTHSSNSEYKAVFLFFYIIFFSSHRYMTQRQLAWRTDSSNSEAKYKRNRVRLQLVPLLEVREESEKKIKKKRNRVCNRVRSWLRC